MGNSQVLHKQDLEKALSLVQKGRFDPANEIFLEYLRNPSEDRSSRILFARLSFLLGEIEQAINAFSRALDEDPDNVDVLNQLGICYARLRNWDQAIAVFEKVLRLAPNSSEYLVNLGRAYISGERYVEGAEVLESAVKMKPGELIAHSELAVALSNMGRSEEALQHVRMALELAPGNIDVLIFKGGLLSEQGQLTEAQACFEKAVKMNPKSYLAYDKLAFVKKFSRGDMPFIAKVEKLLDRSMSANERSRLHFTIGKMFDDCEEWGRAFTHYQRANLLSQVAEDSDSSKQLLSNYKKVFTTSLMIKAETWGNMSQLPVFVVGMPRSGTTLTERIIASHPDAAAAGELNDIRKISLTISTGASWRRFRGALTEDRLAEYSDSFLDRLRNTSESALRVTDKMPDNYMQLGLIHLMFPKARIIHVVRNPLDTCLSCYFQPFLHVRWAFSLENIAKRYCTYRKFMDYWKGILPPETIVEVRYEDLVENTEVEIRRVIDACGLPWDPTCLEFNRIGGVVKTASLWQVRQPMYRSSKQRWRNYAGQLRELAVELRKYLSAEDIEGLAEHGVNLPRKMWWRGLSG